MIAAKALGCYRNSDISFTWENIVDSSPYEERNPSRNRVGPDLPEYVTFNSSRSDCIVIGLDCELS